MAGRAVAGSSARSVLRGSREIPAVDPDRGDEDAAEVALECASLATDRARRGECLEVALGEAKVSDRPLDPTVLDVERPVAGHPGDDRELWMDGVRVMERRHEKAAIETLDQLVTRRLTGRRRHVERERPVRVRSGQAVASRRPPGASRGLSVEHDITA